MGLTRRVLLDCMFFALPFCSQRLRRPSGLGIYGFFQIKEEREYLH
jgi:hypothetical protein